jgi:hypothetical protein
VFTIAEMWERGPANGAFIDLQGAVVTSGRTEAGDAFYVQDATGLGMEVNLAGIIATWPPPVGSPVWMKGFVNYQLDGPALDFADQDDGEVLGAPVELVVLPYEAQLTYALVTTGIAVSSATDPLGHADGDTAGLDAAFGVAPPGWGATGTIVGIVTEPERISLRDADDFVGDPGGAAAIPTTISAIRGGEHADGTPVVVEGTQITPWSRDERYVVIQDGVDGLWVDAGGWLTTPSAVGDVVQWEGEVRSDGEGLRLRTWQAPTPLGTATPLPDSGLIDGALVTRTFTEPVGPDALGDWTTAETVVLADRFTVREALPAPVTVTGVVRVSGETTTLYPLP